MTSEHGVRLQWPGRADAARRALESTTSKTELPEDVGHLLISGDNLEALKLLQPAYTGQIKLIYLDPPHNTGQALVYHDIYSTEDWLTMMYPRLLLARGLLSFDGAIVVSIGHEESHTLRLLLDDVFGPANHVADVVWQKEHSGRGARFFAGTHESLLVYARSLDRLEMNVEPRGDVADAGYADPDGDPRGPWKPTPLHARSGVDPDFVHTFANGRTWTPPAGAYSRFTHERLDALDAAGAIWFGAHGTALPVRKAYLDELAEGLAPTTVWLHPEVGHRDEADDELRDLGLAGVFDQPKPTRLIRRLLQLFTGPDDVVLDLFAGSGSTAHAVITENISDGGNRRSISVQSADPVPDGSRAAKAGFSTVAEITAARIRAVLKAEGAEAADLLDIRLRRGVRG